MQSLNGRDGAEDTGSSAILSERSPARCREFATCELLIIRASRRVGNCVMLLVATSRWVVLQGRKYTDVGPAGSAAPRLVPYLQPYLRLDRMCTVLL